MTKRITRAVALQAAVELLQELHATKEQWVRGGIAAMLGSANLRLPQLRDAYREPLAVLDCESARQGFAALIMTLGLFEAQRLLDVDVKPHDGRFWQ